MTRKTPDARPPERQPQDQPEDARTAPKSADPDNTDRKAGLRRDLADPGKDERGGDGGGVGNSL